MPAFSEKSEIDAYYLSDPAHQRAAGVMWPAIVERRIERLFETALRPDQTVRNEVFQPTGALGNYAVKVRLAYLLGWVDGDVYADLLTLAKIRNRFAHILEATSFSDQKLNALLNNLRVYKLIPGMAERAKATAKADPSGTNRAAAFIASQMLEDELSGFRFCIDMLISHLEKCQKQMERNLRYLPGNWLVADPVDASSDGSE